MSDQTEQELTSILLEFYHEVTKTTTLLMYLIAGIENAYNNRRRVFDTVDFSPPNVSSMDIFPFLIGCDREDLLGCGGEAEQMAYKAWVLQVYNNIWEGHSRHKLSKTSDDPRAIPWEIDAMGDFRHIRNDLVHNNGIATNKEIGKCKTLKWFKPGDRIVLSMSHVLDFLNQIGFLSRKPVISIDQSAQKGQIWFLKGRKQSLLEKSSTAKIISVRIEQDKNPDTGELQFPMEVVFDNGVFGDGILYHIAFDEDLSPRGKIEFAKKVEIDEDGNLVFPNGYLISAERLYCYCVTPDDKRWTDIHRTGMWGPAIKSWKPPS